MSNIVTLKTIKHVRTKVAEFRLPHENEDALHSVRTFELRVVFTCTESDILHTRIINLRQVQKEIYAIESFCTTSGFSVVQVGVLDS